ncbi:MAG: hypothetical protein ACLTBP_04090 [Frisingicoccus sp.]
MKIIQTENLSKYYGKARGIIDMNLSVEGGDIFGFIGPNGAGKYDYPYPARPDFANLGQRPDF